MRRIYPAGRKKPGAAEAAGLNAAVRRDRLILHCWIMVLTFTGMRPTEAKRLNWGDVLGYEASRTTPIGNATSASGAGAKARTAASCRCTR